MSDKKPCPICPQKTTNDNNKVPEKSQESSKLNKMAKSEPQSKSTKRFSNHRSKIRTAETFLEPPYKHSEIIETFEHFQDQIRKVSQNSLNEIFDTIESKFGRSSALSFQKFCVELSKNSKSNGLSLMKPPENLQNNIVRMQPEKVETFPFRMPLEMPLALKFPLRGRNFVQKIEIPLSVAKFGAKIALGGGLLYYAGMHGPWGSQVESYNFVNNLGDAVVDNCKKIKNLFAASNNDD